MTSKLRQLACHGHSLRHHVPTLVPAAVITEQEASHLLSVRADHDAVDAIHQHAAEEAGVLLHYLPSSRAAPDLERELRFAKSVVPVEVFDDRPIEFIEMDRVALRSRCECAMSGQRRY